MTIGVITGFESISIDSYHGLLAIKATYVMGECTVPVVERRFTTNGEATIKGLTEGGIKIFGSNSPHFILLYLLSMQPYRLESRNTRSRHPMLFPCFFFFCKKKRQTQKNDMHFHDKINSGFTKIVFDMIVTRYIIMCLAFEFNFTNSFFIPFGMKQGPEGCFFSSW